MSEPITFDLRSPERAWEPFVDWLKSQSLWPHNVRELTIDPDTMEASAVLMVRDDAGRVKLAPDGLDVLTETKTFTATSPPPRKDTHG
jgi:hypothetical protein